MSPFFNLCNLQQINFYETCYPPGTKKSGINKTLSPTLPQQAKDVMRTQAGTNNKTVPVIRDKCIKLFAKSQCDNKNCA